MTRRHRGLLWCVISLVLGAGCLHESTPTSVRSSTEKAVSEPERPKAGGDPLDGRHEPQAPATASVMEQAAVPQKADELAAPSVSPGPVPESAQKEGNVQGILRPRAARPGPGTLGLSGYGAGGGGMARKMAMAPSYAMAAPPAADMNREAYAHVAENGFHTVRDQPLSTFSVDVDTASYSNVRRFVRDGQLPPADAVRIEELVNYFDYDYPQPESGAPFATYAEVGACPWNPQHRLVHIGIAGRRLDDTNVPARNLVFLIDVSGSMQDANKLPLLKSGMAMLADNVRPEDRVSIVVYAGSSGLVLPASNDRGSIQAALAQLEAGGSTNGAEGIELAYREAQRNFVKGGINRVILATDGDFNVGVTSEGELTRLIEEKRKSGVFLTVLGFGSGNLQDSRMEQLADKGNGNYAYIDDVEEARKVLVREAGATLVTIAKDVKLQVEFNPARVQSYRLVGYENRALANRDFNDDKKDAGEIGAGHTVTALYEVELRKSGEASKSDVDPLRYQGERAQAASSELLNVKIRYKAPDGDTSKLLSSALSDCGARCATETSSSTFRFSAAVAEFGMLLRKSQHKGSSSLEQITSLARSAEGKDPHGDKAQFLDMVRAASRLGLGS